MQDQSIVDKINELSHQEEELWERAGAAGAGLAPAEREQLDRIAVELDQCFDLLRQRQARRSAGLDPDAATVRPTTVVERYQQ
jgi:hypothetical protein